MHADDDGVAGFFEDLPVLAFILAGVFALVSSSATVCQMRLQERAGIELEMLANEFADLLVVKLCAVFPDHSAPDVGSIGALNVTEIASDVLVGMHFQVALVLIHPELKWLRTESSDDNITADRACSTSRLLKVLLPDGGVGIMEVRCVVF